MLPNCVGMTNTTTLHKTERVISEKGYQELQSTYNWKEATEVGVKMWEISISALGIK